MRSIAWLVAALLVLVLPGSAWAGAYPDKPIRLVVPYPPGGPNDFVARLIQPELSKRLGQPVLIDNRPGADGIIGEDIVSKAAPDGYTLLIVSSSHAMNPAVYATLPYDTEKAFIPIAELVGSPLVLVVNPSVPVHSTAELIAYAKAHPGEINYSSSGTGSSNQLAAELFDAMAGIKMVHIPYKGGAPALTAVAGGEAQVIFVPVLIGLPMIHAGKVRALAMTSPQRMPDEPDLPTIAETLPGFQTVGWYGLVAPAGTPAPIIQRLSTELRAIVGEPDVAKRIGEVGGEAIDQPPEAFRVLIHDEIAKWDSVAKKAGIHIK